MDKGDPLMPLEYSFTIQYTDHSKIYSKQTAFQRQENMSKGSLFYVVGNNADFEQNHQDVYKPGSKIITNRIFQICINKNN